MENQLLDQDEYPIKAAYLKKGERSLRNAAICIVLVLLLGGLMSYSDLIYEWIAVIAFVLLLGILGFSGKGLYYAYKSRGVDDKWKWRLVLIGHLLIFGLLASVIAANIVDIIKYF